MAKPATQTKEKEAEDLTSKLAEEQASKGALAAQGGATALAEQDFDLDKAIESDKGGGLSKDAADNMVPLIYLLQSGSPQVKNGEAARIEGAEAGDIWLRGAEKQIIKAKDGIVFQPCHFYKELIEWLPERGGFVARHDIELMKVEKGKVTFVGDLADVKEVQDPKNPDRKIYARENGNAIVETRCHAGYVYEEGFMPMPFIINLSSTGHTFSKQWMFLMNSQTYKGKQVDKSWVFLYRMKTTLKKNNKGSWYMYTAIKERGVGFLGTDKEDKVQGAKEYNLGKSLFEAMIAGTMKAETPIADAETGDFSNDEGDDENKEM